MKCIYCKGRTKVTNSRPRKDSVMRMRECRSCGKRFATREIFRGDLSALKDQADAFKRIMHAVKA